MASLHQKSSAPGRLHDNVLHHQASRKLKEFLYKRFRHFVKHSCAQENIR